jgi:malate dehydrogenase
LFGITKTLGVAADLSHVNTRSKVKGFLPPNGGLRKALAGADLVIITASAPMRRGVSRIFTWLPTCALIPRLLVDHKVRSATGYNDEYTNVRHGVRDDLFRVCPVVSSCARRWTDLLACQINAGIIRDLATGIALTSPKALILVISNPVNAIVPLVAEVLKRYGVFDPRRYDQTHALGQMNYVLTGSILISGSLVPPLWMSTALPFLLLRS